MDLKATELYRYVVRCGYRVFLSQEETEDLAADLIAKHGRDKSDQEFTAFLRQPLTSHLRQDLRCDILDRKRAVVRSRSREFAFSALDDASFPSKFRGTASLTERIERSVLLRAFLQRLPADQSECIVLRYFDQLDNGEIAARLHITRDAVEKRIQRALKRLRQEWETDEAKAALPSNAKRSPYSEIERY